MARPYFRFFPTDFMGDIRVQAMSAAGRGAYISLMCVAWQNDPGGRLPLDDRMLARWSGMTTEEWAAVRGEVLAAFKTVELNDGVFIDQPRLMEEAKRVDARMAQTRDAANKRWNKDRTCERISERTTNPEPEPEPEGKKVTTHADAYPVASGEVNSSERFVTKAAVQVAWGTIPLNKQRGMGRFRDAFILKVTRAGVDAEMVGRQLSAYYESDEGRGKYARGPTTLINDEFWNEDKAAWEASKSNDSADPESISVSSEWLESLGDRGDEK